MFPAPAGAVTFATLQPLPGRLTSLTFTVGNVDNPTAESGRPAARERPPDACRCRRMASAALHLPRGGNPYI